VGQLLIRLKKWGLIEGGWGRQRPRFLGNYARGAFGRKKNGKRRFAEKDSARGHGGRSNVTRGKNIKRPFRQGEEGGTRTLSKKKKGGT